MFLTLLSFDFEVWTSLQEFIYFSYSCYIFFFFFPLSRSIYDTRTRIPVFQLVIILKHEYYKFHRSIWGLNYFVLFFYLIPHPFTIEVMFCFLIGQFWCLWYLYLREERKYQCKWNSKWKIAYSWWSVFRHRISQLNQYKSG